MTYQALRVVNDSRAFEATRPFEELSFYHVAFDSLNDDNKTEATLTRLVANQGRVAIIGPSGCGKSSVYLPVWVP